MKVEIWSDIMCPFCYIGKRKFEQGLAAFEGKDDIEIVWRSYQLMPDLDKVPKLDAHTTLAQKKGISYEQAKEMNQYVTEMAAEVGLSYHMDKAQLANTYDAHRFAHFAAQQGLGDRAEEKLFLAYFTEGKNVGDHETLVQLGTELGLDAQKIREVLTGNAFTDEVEKDIRKAYENGVRGVPFFVFNEKYAVSGAQPAEMFLSALQKSWVEWKKKQPLVAFQPGSEQGGSCGIDGKC